MMTPERFFELMLQELESNPEMQPYYKFLGKQSSWHFRRNYFLQRLKYIQRYLLEGQALPQDLAIWDCGCGYGTTCLFLAMNGVKTFGTTLEFYFETLQKRLKYWSQFGDSTLFSYTYENLFDEHPPANSFDWIIVQDTLHHLEPINEAMHIFHDCLKENGKVLAIEENGSNVIQRLKLFKYRGNKRIITIWDERLQKNILLGNENIRGLAGWNKLFTSNGFKIEKDSVQFIRYFLPVHYRLSSPETLLKKEQKIQSKPGFRREYFFFGLNFVTVKQ